jgi:hypothetical protein
MAGSIFYLAPVENASGKIFGKKQMFVAVRRVWGKRKKGCSVTGERDLVNHPMTEDEMNRQARFGAICKATILRLADPTKKTQDQMAFKEQTDYKTLRQYVWHQCAEEYDNNNA